VVPYHIFKYRKKFRSVLSARKIMTTVIKDVRNVILVNSQTIPAHTEKFHCLLSLSLSYKRNDWSVAPIWQQQATHKCALHRQLHRSWVDSVATPILKSWPGTIGFWPVWSSKNLSATTPSHIAWGTAECHSVIAADKGGNFYWAGIHALVGRWKRTVWTSM
jgi:hypothetical protein